MRLNSRYVVERLYTGPRPAGASKSLRSIWLKLAKPSRLSVAEAVASRARVDGGFVRIREA